MRAFQIGRMFYVVWAVCLSCAGLAHAAGPDDPWPADRLFTPAEPWVQNMKRSIRQASAEHMPTSLEAEQGPVEPGERRGEAPPQREAEGALEAEEEEHIETDRDSFTPATTTVGRGRLVVESAYTFVDNRNVAETHSYPETILRFGLSERLELRVGWNYEVGGAGNSTSGQGEGGAEEPELPGGMGGTEEGPKIERAARMAYGAKLALMKQEGFLPESAVILQGFTPTEGPSTTTTFVGSYVLGWKLLSDMKLDAGVRYGTAEEEGDRFGNFAPSVVLRVPMGERWTAHAEWFGIFSDHRETDAELQYASPGLHYLVTPDFEVGVRVGWGLTDQSAKFFCNSGIGVRF